MAPAHHPRGKFTATCNLSANPDSNTPRKDFNSTQCVNHEIDLDDHRRRPAASGGRRPPATATDPRSLPAAGPVAGPSRRPLHHRLRRVNRLDGHAVRVRPPSEKDANLAQNLGQLQPFIAVFPQECMGQLASFGPA